MLAIYAVFSIMLYGGVNAYGLCNTCCEIGLEEECNPIKFRTFTKLHGLPNAEELKALCPWFLEKSSKSLFLEKSSKCLLCRIMDKVPECRWRFFQWCGNGGNWLFHIQDEIKIVNDICDENSELHKMYIKNVQCIEEVTISAVQKCRERGEKYFKDLMNYKYRINGPIYEWNTYKQTERRVVSRYKASCLTNATSTCGEDAGNLVTSFFEKAGYFKWYGVKTEFVEMVKGFMDTIPDKNDYLRVLK